MERAWVRRRRLPYFDQRWAQVEERTEEAVSVDYREMLRRMASNEVYNFLMAVVTIYSIFAIDFVKSLAGQPTAYIFGYVHIVFICVFALQMVMNGLIREGYLLSFYFWIDLVSTVSMVMEITWVDNWLALNSNLPAVLTIAKVVKASRLSRIGGRAAKILLIFINYFKTKHKEEEQKAQDAKNADSVNGESQLKTETAIDSKLKSDNEEEEENNTELVHELPKKVELANRLEPISEERISEHSNDSDEAATEKTKRTGKSKVSASNFLLLGRKRSKIAKSMEKSHAPGASARKTFEITNIVERLEQTFKLEPLHRINVDPLEAIELERRWQELLEKEQRQKNESREKIKSNKENFKLGESLKERIQQNIILLIMSLIIILPLISADTWYNSDPTLDQMAANYIAVAANTSYPALTHAFLARFILSSFEMSAPVMYLRAEIANKTYVYPDDFPNITQPQAPLSDYMETEKIVSQGDGFLVVFNNRDVMRVSSFINIVRSCFITLLLIFSTIIFMYSIDIHALIPLESMCVSINKISTNPFDALRDVSEHEEQPLARNDIETNILEKAIWKMTSLLVIGAGEQGSQLIETKIDDASPTNSLRLIDSQKVHGIFMYLKLANFEEIDAARDDTLTYINTIAAEVHGIVIRNGGTIIENDCPFFLGFWKTPEDLNIEFETTKYFTANNPLKNLGKTIETQKLIQLALRTYLQVSMALHRLSKARMEDSPKDRLDDTFEQFVLQAGFHIGDGFSGSIGSNLKLEVKCLGCDVQYAKNLCRLAGRYGLSNVLSEEICDILDDHEPNYLRKMDYVREGSGEAGWLYTYDFTLLPLIHPEKYQTRIRLKQRRTSQLRSFRRKYNRNSLYTKRNEILARIKSEPIENVLPLNHHEKNCQKMFNFSFYNTWNEALEKYFNGDWDDAASLFESIKEYYLMSYNDILSATMLERINGLRGVDLEGWNKAQTITFE